MGKTDPEKIAVTREDVLTALGKSNARDLHTVGDIALAVVSGVRNVEHVWDTKSALWYVHQADMKRLLADMVAGGALVLRTGSEWHRHGTPTWLGRPNGNYYALPEKARAWQEAADQKRAEVLQEKAEEFARGVLAERYPEEFASLVHAYREENGAAVAEGAGQ